MKFPHRAALVLRTAGLACTAAGVALMSFGTAVSADENQTHLVLSTAASGLLSPSFTSLMDTITLTKVLGAGPDIVVPDSDSDQGFAPKVSLNTLACGVDGEGTVLAANVDIAKVTRSGNVWTATTDPVTLDPSKLASGENDLHWSVSWKVGDATLTDCETVTVWKPEIRTVPSKGAAVGGVVSDTAYLADASNAGDHSGDRDKSEDEVAPTGTVAFSLYSPGRDRRDQDCVGKPTGTSTATITAGAEPGAPYTAGSGPIATAALGTNRWSAGYSGDVNNLPASELCGEPIPVVPAQPVLTTTPSTGGTVGIDIRDTAYLAGAFDPTGVVSFSLYGPSDPTCTGTPVFTDSEVAGLSATTHDYTTAAVGVYHWSASYPGDTNNVQPAPSVCTEAVTISAAPTPTPTPTPTATPTSTTTTSTSTSTSTAAGVSAAAASTPTIASPSTGAEVPFAAGGFLLVSGLGLLGLGASRRRRSTRDGS